MPAVAHLEFQPPGSSWEEPLDPSTRLVVCSSPAGKGGREGRKRARAAAIRRPDWEALVSSIKGGTLQLAPFPVGKQSRAGCPRQLDAHGGAFRTPFRGEMQGSVRLCGAQCDGGPGGLRLYLERLLQA